MRCSYGQGTDISSGLNWSQDDWLLSPGDFSSDGCMDVLARTAPPAASKLYMYEGSCAQGGVWWKNGGQPTEVGQGWHGEIDWIDGGPG